MFINNVSSRFFGAFGGFCVGFFSFQAVFSHPVPSIQRLMPGEAGEMKAAYRELIKAPKVLLAQHVGTVGTASGSKTSR